MVPPISKKTWFIITGIAVLSIALLYFFFDAGTVPYFPRCPLNYFTGLYCPGCGSQRALSAVLHGHLYKAVSFNPLFVISLPLLLYSAGVHAVNTFGKKPVQQRLVYSPLFIRFLFVTVILFFIFRNIPGYPFSLLRPA